MALSDTTQIREVFERELSFTVTPQLANAVIKFVTCYESRDTHPEAFNSPYLGLHPCFFLTKDRDEYFNLFDCDYKYVERLIFNHSATNKHIFGIKTQSLLAPLQDFVKSFFTRDFNAVYGANLTASDIRTASKDITSVNLNFKVASDPFNIFSIYVVYKFLSSKLPDKLKHEVALKVLMLLQYKFFTSLVNHRFKYKPSEDAMRATYEQISAKFDIKQYGTWREVMRVRAEDFLDPKGVHYPTLLNFKPDLKILYAITDLQTRVRNQINIFTSEFMRIKETGDRIGGYTVIGADQEGDKIIVDMSSHFDTMIAGVYQDAMSVPRFLDDTVIRLVVKFFNSITATSFRAVLISFSEYAVKQARSGQQMLVKEIDGEPTDVGAQILLSSIIQKTYRYLSLNNVDLKSVIAILKGTKDVYSSSRILDQGILEVRHAVGYLLSQIQSSTREATVTALRTGFVMYIILISFKYIKK